MTRGDVAPGDAAHGVTLTRRFQDDPETLFRAFTDADALRQWWGPRGFTIDAITFRAVVNETYRVTLTAPDGSQWAHEGRILEVDPPRRLVYTWRWVQGPLSREETLVEITFARSRGTTLVSVTHSRFVSDAECDAHAIGWADTFERVQVWLAGSSA